MQQNYYDLTSGDLSLLSVEKNSYFECIIKDGEGVTYTGFVLARSKTGKAVTVCDVSFQKSSKDNKYHPRLTFKRTNELFEEKKVKRGSLTQRISFEKGADGYREFWQMVGFLKGFGDLVDTGDFEKEYRIASSQEVLDYLKQKSKLKDNRAFSDIVDGIGVDSAAAIHVLTTLKLLNTYRDQLISFIREKADERKVQDWIDEDEHSHRQDRCMIFGLEFINFKREGGASGDRYDILTRVGSESEERVLIELKSPSDEVFELKQTQSINGKKDLYSISHSLSRAIPQILEYRKTLEGKSAGDPELEKIDENNAVRIAKCIIVIGTEQESQRWKKNLVELRRALSSNLEIWTYTDLLRKVESVIQNLEQRRS